MADAFTVRGVKVTLVEYFPTVLNTVHTSFGKMVEDELKRHGVEVHSGTAVDKIQQNGERLLLTGSSGFSATGNLVLVAAGAKPESEIAKGAGILLNPQGAIKVNQFMETNIPNIYAAGDCVETWHQLLQKNVYMPLGTTAHKQGRVAGENAVGGKREFQGSLGTQVVKVFDLAIARTGLREEEARQAGYDPLTVSFETWDHKVYYPGAHPFNIRVTADVNTKAILGAQIIGHYQGEVAKRIDIFATAIFHRMSVEQLNDLDLSYTPPLSSPWDPVQMAVQAWSKQLNKTG
ncbi:FAD-dependent oxidoreductase [Desulfosarcina cetonica]|uniref:FAD-dependent oxidoreductase n=1 Tax=Desulfosarcina cetonica TaxID=90730 RepID=UPI00248B9661|nr:FAD-dependent oxidoreductase [Desulfosarcina cetonica]